MTSFGYNVLGFGVNANPVVTATPSIVSSGLILHLDAGNTDSYSGSGTSWNNLISDDFDGTLTNGPTFSSGDGGSIVFDGSNDYVDFGSEDLDPEADGLFADSSHAWSASAWFKPSSSLTDRGVILGRGGVGNATHMTIFYDGRSSGDDLDVRLRGSKTTINDTNITSTFSEVTITWDGTTAKTYFNGSFVTNAGVGSQSETSKVFAVGSGFNNFGNPHKHFQGNIAEVKVYSDALTAAEVLQNYNALKGRFGL